MRSSFAHAAERLAFGILVATLFLAPFPVASNRDGPVGITSTVLAFAVFCFLLAKALGFADSRTPPVTRLGASFLGLIALVVGWVWVGPLVHHFPALDLARAEVYQLKALAYWCVPALVLFTVRTRTRFVTLLTAVVVSGTLEAILAVVSLSSQTEFSLLGTAFPPGQRAQGTFANSDHFANYMAMCMALALGLMLATAEAQGRTLPGWRGRVLGLLNFLLSKRMLVRLAVIIMVIGLVLTRSRMGNASFFVGLFFLLSAVAWAWPHKRQAALWLGISLLVIDLVVIGQWVGLEHVVERLQNTELSAGTEQDDDATPSGGRAPGQEETVAERLAIGQDAFKLALTSPWVGHGPATFFTLFPQHKRPAISIWVEHAHNDYAELASDLGLPALLTLGGAVCLSLLQWAQLMRSPSSGFVKGVVSGAGMALVCLLMHAWVDFNLHIHANAMLFTVALALPFALSRFTRTRHAGKSAL